MSAVASISARAYRVPILQITHICAPRGGLRRDAEFADRCCRAAGLAGPRTREASGIISREGHARWASRTMGSAARKIMDPRRTSSSTSHANAAPSTGWPRRRQLAVLGLAAGILAVAVALTWLSGRGFLRGNSPEAPPPPPAGTFRPTVQQLKTLTIEPVALRQFVSEERTEGKIAVNGDRATPVYSPYSGRVTRVIANLGDIVAQGAPLATIDASEFSQAQNDLRTGMAAEPRGARAARSHVRPARSVRAR